jgi:hypothetical protein
VKEESCWENVVDGASGKRTLKVGTKVEFLVDQGSYTRVRTEDGYECHIASGAIEPIKK